MKNVIDELLNESLERKIVEKQIPNSLLDLFLVFFDNEDHDEILEFIYEKITNSSIAIPMKFYLLLEILCSDFENMIYDLEDIYYRNEEDSNEDKK